MTYYPHSLTSISTTAQPTGDHVNGKPVYRKIVKHTGNLTISTANAVAHGISSFSKILRIEGTMLRSNGATLPLEWHDRTGTNFQSRVYADATNVYIDIAAAWTGAGNVLSDPWIVIDYVI